MWISKKVLKKQLEYLKDELEIARKAHLKQKEETKENISWLMRKIGELVHTTEALTKENAEQFKTLLNHNDLLIHTKEMITLHEETLVLLLNHKITNVLCQINQAKTTPKKESKQQTKKIPVSNPMESCVGVKKETPKKTTTKTKTTKKPQK